MEETGEGDVVGLDVSVEYSQRVQVGHPAEQLQQDLLHHCH